MVAARVEEDAETTTEMTSTIHHPSLVTTIMVLAMSTAIHTLPFQLLPLVTTTGGSFVFKDLHIPYVFLETSAATILRFYDFTTLMIEKIAWCSSFSEFFLIGLGRKEIKHTRFIPHNSLFSSFSLPDVNFENVVLKKKISFFHFAFIFFPWVDQFTHTDRDSHLPYIRIYSLILPLCVYSFLAILKNKHIYRTYFMQVINVKLVSAFLSVLCYARYATPNATPLPTYVPAKGSRSTAHFGGGCLD